jgi:RHS repeat-associated protein
MARFYVKIVFFLLLVFGFGSAHSQSIKNYVVTKTYKQKSKDLTTTDVRVVDVNVTYKDGIGRAIQSVNSQSTTTGKDLVRHFEYDNMSRSTTQYLPFTIASDTTGKFIQNPTTNALSFYATPPVGVAQDTKPFSSLQIEATPLGRLTSQTTLGQHFSNKPTINRYTLYRFNANADKGGFNGETAVKKFTYTGNYDANDETNLNKIQYSGTFLDKELMVVENKTDSVLTPNGSWQQVRTYQDMEGKVILKRVYLGTIDAIWLDTYYVYDDLDQVRAIITPKLSALGFTLNTLISATNLANLAYCFHYDDLGRATIKRNPGKSVEYIIYDAWDRVVFTQDGNQRAKTPNKKWNFIKYDVINRVAMTGEADCNLTRLALQNNVNAKNAEVDRFVVRSGQFYTLTNNPTGVTITTATHVYKVNYYDDYIFDKPVRATVPAGSVTSVKGFRVGGRTRVLRNDNVETWLLDVNYYDQDYRPMQSFTDLFDIPLASNPVEVISVQYDPAYQVRIGSESTWHLGLQNQDTLKVASRYVYDHVGRIKQTYHKVKNQPEVLLKNYIYNELGQVIKKNLYQTSGQTTFAQSLDFEYHIQGALKKITSPLFKQELYYDIKKDNTDGYFTGNITESYWSIKGELLKGQTYTYDKAGRLLSALSSPIKVGGAAAAFNYTEEGINYDLNGNLSKLQRKWNGTLIDNLTYNYEASQQSNRLATVTDAITNPTTIPKGVSKVGNLPSSTVQFTYDANGNVTKDNTRGITDIITYNYLDLLNQVQVPITGSATKRTLTYTYDADGDKLKFESSSIAGNPGEKIIYAGIAEYNASGYVTRIGTDEGLIYSNGSNGPFEYQYYLRDHLGNVRVVMNTLGDTVQTTNFYPFGMAIKSDAQLKTQKNRYLFNSQEVQPELTYYDYGARMYDPLIGRWNSQDPMNQFDSPYNYLGGDPINSIDPSGMFTMRLRDFVDYGGGPNLLGAITAVLQYGSYGYGLTQTPKNAKGVLSPGRKYTVPLVDRYGKKSKGTQTVQGKASNITVSAVKEIRSGVFGIDIDDRPFEDRIPVNINLRPTSEAKYYNDPVVNSTGASPKYNNYKIYLEHYKDAVNNSFDNALEDEEYTRLFELMEKELQALDKGHVLSPQEQRELYELWGKNTEALKIKHKIDDIRKQAVEKAWNDEIAIIKASNGTISTANFTPDEIKLILETGKKLPEEYGYEGHHINNVESNWDLAGDPNNIMFVKGKAAHIKLHGGSFRGPRSHTSGKLIDRKGILRNIQMGSKR